MRNVSIFLTFRCFSVKGIFYKKILVCLIIHSNSLCIAIIGHISKLLSLKCVSCEPKYIHLLPVQYELFDEVVSAPNITLYNLKKPHGSAIEPQSTCWPFACVPRPSCRQFNPHRFTAPCSTHAHSLTSPRAEHIVPTAIVFTSLKVVCLISFICRRFLTKSCS